MTVTFSKVGQTLHLVSLSLLLATNTRSLSRLLACLLRLCSSILARLDLAFSYLTRSTISPYFISTRTALASHRSDLCRHAAGRILRPRRPSTPLTADTLCQHQQSSLIYIGSHVLSILLRFHTIYEGSHTWKRQCSGISWTISQVKAARLALFRATTPHTQWTAHIIVCSQELVTPSAIPTPT